MEQRGRSAGELAAVRLWLPRREGGRGPARNDAATQATALSVLEVTGAAGSAFFDLAAAHELVDVAQANLKRFETFARAVHVLVDNQLRPGADASQADAQLALARNQLVQAETQQAVRRSALAAFLQMSSEQVSIDATAMLTAAPGSDLQTSHAATHPAVLEEGALSLQQLAQKRVLDRSYVPSFSTLARVYQPKRQKMARSRASRGCEQILTV